MELGLLLSGKMMRTFMGIAPRKTGLVTFQSQSHTGDSQTPDTFAISTVLVGQ